MTKTFIDFPKMARLSREIIITEKIDGTNSSVDIIHKDADDFFDDPNIIAKIGDYHIRAGSRTKWITPENDNFGFAKWVKANAEDLGNLGEGHHFGEWWGQGIQSGYGLREKRFSLFNVARWADDGKDQRPFCCHVVPVLYRGDFDMAQIYLQLHNLEKNGSVAAPGFMKPEGIIVWHTAANIGFKKTILKDEVPKSLAK